MSDEKVKILMVDDHEENLISLTETLGDLNLDIIKSNSGKEAIRHCVDNDFALILLDVVMPEMDGFETAILLRQHERFAYTPIIFLTAQARSEAEMFKGYSLGAVDYIIIPYNPNVLKAKVTRFVDLFKYSQTLKRQEEELKSSNDRLERSIIEITKLKNHLKIVNEQLGAFSYSVSHDLQAPLRIVDGFSQKLLAQCAEKLDGDSKDHLLRIRSGIQHMKELIEDLLALSRVTQSEIKVTRVDLSALSSAVAADIKNENPKRQVKFIIQDNLVVNGDEHLLKIVLENLLGNSWKFTANRENATIELGSKKVKEQKTYFVRDNGSGFDMKYADKLFTPFQRLHTSEEFAGTGIGLSIVQRIISRHGGKVWGEGIVDRGATFYFTLGTFTGNSATSGSGV